MKTMNVSYDKIRTNIGTSYFLLITGCLRSLNPNTNSLEYFILEIAILTKWVVISRGTDWETFKMSLYISSFYCL